MDVKYLSDDKGKITGVFIPLAEWERLCQHYNITDDSIPAANPELQQKLTGALQKAKPAK